MYCSMIFVEKVGVPRLVRWGCPITSKHTDACAQDGRHSIRACGWDDITAHACTPMPIPGTQVVCGETEAGLPEAGQFLIPQGTLFISRTECWAPGAARTTRAWPGFPMQRPPHFYVYSSCGQFCKAPSAIWEAAVANPGSRDAGDHLLARPPLRNPGRVMGFRAALLALCVLFVGHHGVHAGYLVGTGAAIGGHESPSAGRVWVSMWVGRCGHAEPAHLRPPCPTHRQAGHHRPRGRRQSHGACV